MTLPSNPPESSVDTLRRRARRRLVGAVTLAIAAAIALPLVFEKEAPPLPDEVDIRIPAIDKTPFEPKTITQGKVAAKADAAIAAAPAVSAAVAPVAAAIANPPAVNADEKSAPKVLASPVAPETKPAQPVAQIAKPEIKAEVKAEPKPEAKGAAAKADVKPEPKADVSAESKPADPDGPKNEPKAGDWVVQLVAVRDANSARDVLEKARTKGYKTAYREKIDVNNGTVTRVRTGPYKDKAFAEKTRNKLEAEGFEAVVVQIK